MKRDTVEFIINLLGSDLFIAVGVCGRKPISMEKQVLLSIWTMATPDSYRSVCDRFDVGKATAWRTLWKFVKAVNKHLPMFIKWPNAAEAARSYDYIQNNYGFPRVLGAVDGTHIKISAPHVNPHDYINRKGFYSIQTQVVCDHTLKFTHIYADKVGPVHDSRVFRRSGLQDFCTQPNFPNDGHLLADQAYILQQYIIVPYRNNDFLDAASTRFNTVHSSSRMTVERSIGLWKGRFRSLLDKLPIKRTDLISFYIIATAVLHNICILQDDLLNIPVMVDGNAVGVQVPLLQVLNNAMRAIGFNKRELLKNEINNP